MLSAQHIKQTALALGFDACGIAPAGEISAARQQEFAQWLADGKHGEMDYLRRHASQRADVRRLVPGARSVVSLAMNYYSPLPASHALARYAYGTDYHEVVRKRLDLLMRALQLTPPADGRTFVDTAPIDEKYWAEAAGVGWRGKHTQIIVPGHGTYCFLAELVLTHEVDAYDAPLSRTCGSCTACLEACPAKTLQGDGTMDARRCLSYLTIEHRGPLPPEAAAQMGTCIYGCDRCAEACPHNRHASPTKEPLLAPRESLLALTRADFARLTPETFRTLFTHSAVKRTKYEGLMRNVQVVEASSSETGNLSIKNSPS